MRLEEFSLKEPFWVIVGALLVTILGMVSYFKLPKDILPLFRIPAVQVLTLYPGMPADIVEKDITTRLERWTGQSNGIAHQESRSMTGVSILKDFFRSDIDPNTAMSQVTSFAMSDLYYLPPGTIPPMVMPFDPTASIPLALLTVDNPDMDETKLYDVAYFDLRNMLQGIPGVIAPAVYGGRLRRILAYVDPYKMSERHLSSTDVVNTLLESNVMIPTGNVKFGDFDYQIVSNAMVSKVDEMNQFLVRAEYGVPLRISDVGKVQDSHQIQTNVVRIGDKRRVYIPIYRQPGANTIQIVDAIKGDLKSLLERLPKGMVLKVVADQSRFVRKAIESLGEEVALGGFLSAIVVVVFLANLRASFVVFLSIPLSILFCFLGLYATKETINAMTLGGLALAVGRLIDDSIVVIENTFRYHEMGITGKEAALKAAKEVSMPVLAATVTTVIVFLPVIFLTGIGQFLFTPLAKSVTFSILASYVVSMTIIPLYCSKFLKAKANHARAEKKGVLDSLAQRYQSTLAFLMKRKKVTLGAVMILFAVSMMLYPLLGKELFPRADVGHLTLLVRMSTGTRIEKTEATMAKVEKGLSDLLGDKNIETMITNIGILYDWPAAYTPNSGPGDAFIELELSKHRKKSSEAYAEMIRKFFMEKFPDLEVAINTGGILTAALNMGSSSPINIQVTGKDLGIIHGIAEKIVEQAKQVSGARDVRIQERINYPQIEVELDRDAIAAKRLTVDEVVKNMVTAFNSSVNFKPAFWIDPKNGNHYFLGAQYPEELIRSLDTLKELPITGANQVQVVRLKEIAQFKETKAPSEIRHDNIRRVMNVFVNTSGRDVGAIASRINRAIRDIELPEGYYVYEKGEMKTMKDSFKNLGGGLILAVILVYLILVGQFRSFRDPLLILFSVPMGLVGVFLMLWLTKTTLNIQSFIGVIFMVGIAVSNGILLIEFANRLKSEGVPIEEAALKSARIRFRPILMTTIAALLGLLPMAIGMGHGSEANVPLGRAVIGGLFVSTILTLLVLPLLYAGVEKISFFKRTGKTLGMFLLILFLTRPAHADEFFQGKDMAPVLSFEEVLDIAFRQNPDIAVSKSKVDESKADVTIARSEILPRVNVSGMSSYGLGGSSQALGINGLVNSPFRKNFAGGFDASWMLFDFGRTAFMISSVKKEANTRKEEVTQEKMELKLKILSAYAKASFHRNLVRVLEDRQSEQKGLLEEIGSYLKSGLTSPIELNLTKASLRKTEMNEIRENAAYGHSLAFLKELIGSPNMTPFHCEIPKESLPDLEQSMSDFVNQALERRPELKAARASYEAAKAARRSAQLEHAPRISAVASTGILDDTSLVPKKEWAVGFGVRIPLFDGFQIEGKLKKTKAQEAQAKKKIEKWANRIRQEAATAFVQWRAAKKIRELALDQYHLALDAYQLAHERYAQKMGTFLELRDAEAGFDQAAEDSVRADVDYY
ncbi:MAG: efflux RND transporter permease subunit, partial [Candidatus Omnitrophica bacterium]|nr:efflux RND transporter permease subunit [Candidatus Omnitrophota bacterium]